jgi:hypothetical protein
VRLNGVQEVVGSNPAGPRLIGLSLYLQANYVIYSCGIGASAGSEFLGVLVASVSVSADGRLRSWFKRGDRFAGEIAGRLVGDGHPSIA